jgi:hypothetical protein
MVKTVHFVILLLCCVTLSVGCQGERVTPVAGPVVTPPQPSGPIQDQPPREQRREDPTTVSSVKLLYEPAIPDENKSALVYQARLDLLRILICSRETMVIDGRDKPSDVMRQVVAEHFTNMGFRVLNESFRPEHPVSPRQPGARAKERDGDLNGSSCPEYSASPRELGAIANERDVDMVLLLRGTSKQVDKMGEFYSFEVDGRAKVAQFSGNELLTTQSALVRGKRALNVEQAAESALKVCGEELGKKLSDEIVRKSARGALVRRVRVEGLREAKDVDHIRVDLQRKPGIQSVTLGNWDQRTGVAVFWVGLDASAQGNLGAYLEQLDQIRLRVERLDQTGAESDKKGPLEY